MPPTNKDRRTHKGEGVESGGYVFGIFGELGYFLGRNWKGVIVGVNEERRE